MEKTATLNIRVSPEDKKSAEMILNRLGIPMATAVGMFLKQVSLTGGIPFAVTIPKVPNNINADTMSVPQIREQLNEGLSDIENGRVRSAREAFEQFSKAHSNETL